VLTDGRPTIAMETYVRLMVLRQRYRWGYRTLVAEVSDSIHLRRFCRISLSERVPDESTVRKLKRRLGPETVSELTRALIIKTTREKRFRPRAAPTDGFAEQEASRPGPMRRSLRTTSESADRTHSDTCFARGGAGVRGGRSSAPGTRLYE
jgi:IS5 family transposase